MKLTPYSRKIIYQSFQDWRVPKDFAGPMYAYLVHAFNPGSCFTAVLANDFLGALTRSHPSNTVPSLKALAGWIRDTVPEQARGSYEAVEFWTSAGAEFRRDVLEKARLILPEDQEMWQTLKSEPVVEPVLY